MNIIVTNVPGPQFPLDMLGAEMLAPAPQVPLMDGIGLGIALMSYDGRPILTAIEGRGRPRPGTDRSPGS